MLTVVIVLSFRRVYERMREQTIVMMIFVNLQDPIYLQLYMRQIRSRSDSRSARQNMPRRLFQKMFETTLPQINILTKTEKVITPSRHTTAKTTSRIRSTEVLCKTHHKTVTFVEPKEQPIKLHPRLKKLRERIKGQSRKAAIDNENFIFKSEMVNIRMDESSNMESRKPQNQSNSSEETPLNEPLEIVELHKPVMRNNYLKTHINCPSFSSHLIGKIFDRNEYEDTYDDYNRKLLGAEMSYRTKQFNIVIERDWKI